MIHTNRMADLDVIRDDPESRRFVLFVMRPHA